MKLLKFILIFLGIALFMGVAFFYSTVYSQLAAAKINSAIKKAPIFRKLDKQKEILDGTEIYDSIPRKKSSGVIFYADKKPETKEELEIANFNNCRAFSRKGKILIKLGWNSGFSGSGFNIHYLLGRFEIEPYSFTDVVPAPANLSRYKMIKQEVTLNQFYYHVGDSIYGKINMEMEERINRRTYKVFASGYFRTKVEKW